MVNVYEFYWAAFLRANRVTVELIKSYKQLTLHNLCIKTSQKAMQMWVFHLTLNTYLHIQPFWMSCIESLPHFNCALSYLFNVCGMSYIEAFYIRGRVHSCFQWSHFFSIFSYCWMHDRFSSTGLWRKCHVHQKNKTDLRFLCRKFYELLWAKEWGKLSGRDE